MLRDTLKMNTSTEWKLVEEIKKFAKTHETRDQKKTPASETF